MEFPVSISREARLVECGFATGGDARVVARWAHLARPGDPMLIQDAAEYAGLAAKKRLFFLKAGRLARSVEEVRNATQRDPVAEVAAMLVVRARWHRPEPQLGCALIRRTWSHNLVIDFLFNDPNLLRPEAPNIRGVATGLLFFTMSLGQILGAGRLIIRLITCGWAKK